LRCILVDALAVNALGVVLEDAFLWDVVAAGDVRSFLVAVPAGRREVEEVRRGLLVQVRKDVVVAMAVGAARRHLVTFGGRNAVTAAGMLLALLVMAVRTVDRLWVHGVRVRGVFEVLMAVDAVHVRVHGRSEDLRVVEDRNLLAVPHALEGGVLVALEALFGVGADRRRGQQEDAERGQHDEDSSRRSPARTARRC